MLRISYVIEKERTARSRGQGSRIKEKYIMVDNVGIIVDNMESKTRIIIEFVECMERTLSIRKFLLPLQHKAY